ncbi:hypothetical protein J6590_102699, partial [Homalodisca vitripennis]
QAARPGAAQASKGCYSCNGLSTSSAQMAPLMECYVQWRHSDLLMDLCPEKGRDECALSIKADRYRMFSGVYQNWKNSQHVQK